MEECTKLTTFVANGRTWKLISVQTLNRTDSSLIIIILMYLFFSRFDALIHSNNMIFMYVLLCECMRIVVSSIYITFNERSKPVNRMCAIISRFFPPKWFNCKNNVENCKSREIVRNPQKARNPMSRKDDIFAKNVRILFSCMFYRQRIMACLILLFQEVKCFVRHHISAKKYRKSGSTMFPFTCTFVTSLKLWSRNRIL